MGCTSGGGVETKGTRIDSTRGARNLRWRISRRRGGPSPAYAFAPQVETEGERARNPCGFDAPGVGAQAPRAQGTGHRQHADYVRTNRQAQAAEVAWAITYWEPAGPDVGRALDMYEILVRRHRVIEAGWEDEPRDIAGLQQNVRAQ